MQRIRDLKINFRCVVEHENIDDINENIDTALAIREQGGNFHEVSIRPPRRSNPQNDHFHSMIRDIARNTGDSVEAIKFWVKAEFLGLEEFVFAGKQVDRPRSTSELTEYEMSELIQRTEVLHAEFGRRKG